MEEQKTEFIVRKKDKTENFSIIYNACLKDNSISWQAKGLFGYLMTLPDNWEIYKTELQKHSSNGRDATIKAFDELIEKGYITVEETKGENGKFGRKIYKVFEVSQGETKIIRKKRNTNKDEAPLLNNRSWDTVTGNPLTVNQELLNTNKQITKELNTNTNTSTSLKSEPPKFNPTSKKKSTTSFSKSDYEECMDIYYKNRSQLGKSHPVESTIYSIQSYQGIIKPYFVDYGVETVKQAIENSFYNSWAASTTYGLTVIFNRKKFDEYVSGSKGASTFKSNKNVSGVNMTCDRDGYDTSIF